MYYGAVRTTTHIIKNSSGIEILTLCGIRGEQAASHARFVHKPARTRDEHLCRRCASAYNVIDTFNSILREAGESNDVSSFGQSLNELKRRRSRRAVREKHQREDTRIQREAPAIIEKMARKFEIAPSEFFRDARTIRTAAVSHIYAGRREVILTLMERGFSQRAISQFLSISRTSLSWLIAS